MLDACCLEIMANENDHQLLEFCSLHVTNTYFQVKPQYKISWMRPPSKYWYKLDLLLGRRYPIKNTDYPMVSERQLWLSSLIGML